MVQIKVLGPGCRNCEKLTEAAKKAAAVMGIEAVVEKITDYIEILGYNVMSTPGLVVNEKVVSSGRIPSEAEIKSWLAEALKSA